MYVAQENKNSEDFYFLIKKIAGTLFSIDSTDDDDCLYVMYINTIFRSPSNFRRKKEKKRKGWRRGESNTLVPHSGTLWQLVA